MPWTFHYEDLIEGWPLLAGGLWVTVKMSVIVIALSLVAGTVLGILRHEAPRWLRSPVSVYVEFIRSIPLILFIIFIHYGVMFYFNNLMMRDSDFLESSIVALTLFESAYIAEIIRGGFRSINETERDAARSLGLNYLQRMRHVFVPLVYSRSLPSLISQFISLIKDTSLASIIGVAELTRQGEILYQNTFHDFEVLLFVALTYFVICFSLSRLSRRFEFGAHGKLDTATVQNA